MSLDDLLKQAQHLGEEAVDKAKDVVEDRGGTDSLKTDAAEVKAALTGEGSMKDRATEALEAVEDPGAPGADTPAPAAPAKP